jgi:hypothetical protein
MEDSMHHDGHDSQRGGLSGMSTGGDQSGEPLDQDTYDELLVLERLESLEEEMKDLGVTTLEQLRERIEALHRQLDERE